MKQIQAVAAPTNADANGKAVHARPEDDAPLLVTLGLASLDGAGEVAFCTNSNGSPVALLVDTSRAWEPDGDGDLAAACPSCKQPHWMTPFVRYIQENDFDFTDGCVFIEPGRLMAQTVENLRARDKQPQRRFRG